MTECDSFCKHSDLKNSSDRMIEHQGCPPEYRGNLERSFRIDWLSRDRQARGLGVLCQTRAALQGLRI